MNANRLAKAAALKGQHRQYRVGACIVHAGHVIAVGFNKNKTHPLMGRVKHLHAEVDALLHVKDVKKTYGADIYVTRCNKNGRVGMAKPCETCMGHLRTAGIRNVFYTDSQGAICGITINQAIF
jgi:deoxycytidylate deaminase